MNKQFILDTNLLVSAFLLSKSVSRQVLTMATTAGLLLFSTETIDELTEVIVRPKFDKYVSLSTRLELLESLKAFSKFVPVLPEQKVAFCRDPKDDKFLSLALAAKADCIITGDNDLLVLNPFFGVPIINAEAFLKLLVD